MGILHRIVFSAALAVVAAVLLISCANDVVVFSGASGAGGSGGGSAPAGGTSVAGSGGTSACEQDCSQLDTAPCEQALCDPDSGQCQLVPAIDGMTCDDGQFCSDSDRCIGGVCSGLPNECLGLANPNEACNVRVCDEDLDQCLLETVPNGTPCPNVEPCMENSICQAGICVGTPKGCSHLSTACAVGVCDNGGQCIQVQLSDGTPCDDLNACTPSTNCQAGLCTGLHQTQCLNNDGCCPNNCTKNNDSDCCGNLAQSAIPSMSNGGAGGYGPGNLNDGVDEQQCNQSSCQTACFAWVTNNTNPNGAWIRYDWQSPVIIKSIYLDFSACSGGCSGGRATFSGTVQRLDGITWINVTTFTNANGDVQLDMPGPVVTEAIRIFDLTTNSCPLAINSRIFEWYVYGQPACSP